MILAPRHPERFMEVGEMLAQSGIPFRRRSELSRSPNTAVDVVLLDTIGELRCIYSLASVAVIGGSFLTPFGGHNPLEPAALGKAIIFGPHMSNFKEIAGLLIREQAARQCPLQDLPAILLQLLRDPRARRLLGERAADTVRRNRGAVQNTLALILPHTG
jgi:3-deoxy-D-manno-octulosonic-acid transferase